MDRTEAYFEIERIVNDEGGVIALSEPFKWKSRNIDAVANFEECGHGRLVAMKKTFENWDIQDYFENDELESLAIAVKREKGIIDFFPNNLCDGGIAHSYCLQVSTLMFGGEGENLCDYMDEKQGSPFEAMLEIAYAVSEMFHKSYEHTLFVNGDVSEYLAHYVSEYKCEIAIKLCDEYGIAKSNVEGFVSFCNAALP